MRFVGVVGLVWLVCMCASAMAFALPEGRHYELVSPIFKGGYGVNELEGVAMGGGAEGERVAFWSLGVFAGEPNGGGVDTYIARRGAMGWLTGPLAVPPAIAIGHVNDLSPTLESSLSYGYPAPNTGASESENVEPEFLFHRLDAPQAPYEVLGFPLKRIDGKRFDLRGSAGASPDFCHIIFYTPAGGTGTEAEPLLREAVGTQSNLYELVAGRTVAGCGGETPLLRLVGVSNKLGSRGEPREPEVIDPFCQAILGASSKGGNQFNAVAAQGTEIFFSTNENLADPKCDGLEAEPSNPAILYVRLNGQRTVEVSKPVAADCTAGLCVSAQQERAIFQGANESGTRAFFTTTQPLVTGDNDVGNDLYMASIGCLISEPGCEPAKREVTSLVQVSHDPNVGEAAEVQGVSVLSPDGGRVYFVARGVLSGANVEGHSPIKGADNLYVYDVQDGTTQFIVDLCSGPEASGGAHDLLCPEGLVSGGAGGKNAGNDMGLWGNNASEVQTTGNGRYFLFVSYAQLVGSDTDTTRDVYRYDAQAGTLDRVSIGEAGYDANGNNNFVGAVIPSLQQSGNLQRSHELNYRAISEDGSRVVFETAEPLSPAAVNGLENAYEWHKEPGAVEGRVSLVSSGSDQAPVGEDEEIVITPSGRDIFFKTVQGLLPQDIDGAVDIYDVRLGEGFAELSARRQPCSGDACQGPLTNPAPLLVPGSVSQAPGENVAPLKPLKKATKKRRKKTTKKRAKTHRGKGARRSTMARKSARRSGR